ncbi:DUF4383 domain-containing protein [Kineococcus rubinsiae]|uniref:DUF4383 domain-containing protein n=1 Tax=Kineococcus rubinsiae TaxID=2609562 RepID=UPI0027E5A7E7|nr:DUF4383 domain-containing protein [Kineococcus rubinsiae]
MSTSTRSPSTVRRSPVQLTSLVVGLMFVVVGIAGFVPGITTDMGDMAGAGHTSGSHLLGVFQVSVLHNVLHLLLGVLGILAGRASGAARAFLLVGGIAYAGLWIYGLLVDQTSSANFVPLNTADNWLHLVLAAGMILLALIMPRRTTVATAEHA